MRWVIRSLLIAGIIASAVLYVVVVTIEPGKLCTAPICGPLKTPLFVV